MQGKKVVPVVLMAAVFTVPTVAAATETRTQIPLGEDPVMATPIEIPKIDPVNPIGATPIEIPKIDPTGATPIEIPGDGGLRIIPICDPNDPDCEEGT
ncbi:MAG: hypothetical protein QNJ44_00750 [Rhodobacter sp.]|nr:hypothetical protein [Rhodobacter sp.]